MTDEVVLDAAIQQLHRPVGIQQPRQAFLALGGGEAGGRVVAAVSFLIQIAVQATQRGQQSREAAAGQAPAMLVGDQLANMMGFQLGPLRTCWRSQ